MGPAVFAWPAAEVRVIVSRHFGSSHGTEHFYSILSSAFAELVACSRGQPDRPDRHTLSESLSWISYAMRFDRLDFVERNPERRKWTG